MDELDREEFYRLKKVSGKKGRDAAAAEIERVKKEKEQEAKGEVKKGPETSADILGDEENEDVIF